MPRHVTPFDPGTALIDGNPEQASEALHRWLADVLPQFRQSAEYHALSSGEQQSKGSWFTLIMELNLMYFSGSLADINADTLDEILVDMLPRKLIVPLEQIDGLIPELIACWKWLGRTCETLGHTDDIIEHLLELAPRYPRIYDGETIDGEDQGDADFEDDDESTREWVPTLIALTIERHAAAEPSAAPPEEWLLLHSEDPFSQFLDYILLTDFDDEASEAVDLLLRFAVQNLLTRLRQGETAAEDFWQQTEHFIASVAPEPETAGASVDLLLGALAPLRHHLSENFIAFIQEWHREHSARFAEDQSLSIETLQQGLIELLADAEDEFQFLSLIKEQLAFLPEDAMAALVSTILDIGEPTINDAVALLVLDNDSGAAAAIAEQLASRPREISPTSLARLIRVRNWLTPDVQKSIDTAIRQARKGGIVPAQANPASNTEVLETYATGIDGVGAQGIMLLTRCARRFRLISFVFKEGIGVVDTMVSPLETRGYLQQTIKQARSATGTLQKVDPALVREQIPIFLGLNRHSAINLDHELIQALELIGLQDWNPAAHRLGTLLPETLREPPTEEQLADAQRRSQRWTRNNTGNCWFEEIDFLNAILSQPAEQMVLIVCEQSLEPIRDLWQERMQRMALWAHHASAQTRRKQARDFATIAWLLEQDLPMEEIALMRAIAELSIQVGCEQSLPALSPE